MTKKISPLVSEFETQEQAEKYDRWYREKVEASMNSDRPAAAHDEVMSGARQIIQDAKARRKFA